METKSRTFADKLLETLEFWGKDASDVVKVTYGKYENVNGKKELVFYETTLDNLLEVLKEVPTKHINKTITVWGENFVIVVDQNKWADGWRYLSLENLEPPKRKMELRNAVTML